MAKKRVTGRFYIFLILLCIGVYFVVRELVPAGASEAIVTMAATSYSQTLDAVIVRDETVVSFEGSGRVVYVAAEGAQVRQGDEIADVYSAGYSEKQMNNLETVRQRIRAYHQELLENIVDSELERLEMNVQAAAQELKTLINKKTGGSLLNLERQLEEVMVARQDYLRQNRREDPKLNQLYEEETKVLNNIASWKTVETAPCDGTVSFYLDGCEAFLTPDNLEKITIEDLRVILSGRIPETGESSRLMQSVFRIVSTDKWHLVLISDDTSWNPVTGQVFSFQMTGFEDVVYSGTVVRMQKEAGTVMAQLEITGDIGPLINTRSGRCMIGINLSGLSVPIRAISTQNGQTGVWLNDVPGGTFVPVEVLSTDSQTALIQPLTEGTLAVGRRVLLN